MSTPSPSSVKVVCRFRPINKIEAAHGQTTPVVDFEGTESVKIDSDGGNIHDSFTFDRVFDMDSRQEDVFDYSIKSTVDDVLNGYNGTVFAYGQTGAGKSFTMMGADLANRDLRGVIPRIIEQIFDHIASAPSNMEYTVKVSYMEIYMERIRDLLAPANDNLPIHEDKQRGVYVKGLLEVYVSSLDEVYQVLSQGGASRAVSSTNMNTESSRSHSIFVVTITQKNVETGSAKMGQLNLVDLAGSEKVGKTGASGQTLEEAKKINKSLSALGNVINALTDGKSSHVPYRDSKLTRILQESLGGNSRTTLIINCSPSAYNDAETLSTLRFGMRAKSIKNKAKINAELSPAELKQQLRKARQDVVTYQEYAAVLEGEVTLWRAGEHVPDEKRAKLGTTATPLAALKNGSVEDIASIRTQTPLPGHTPLEKDEREEFLRRENELQDQLSERETLTARQEKLLQTLRSELELLRAHDAEAAQKLETLNAQHGEMAMNLEKATFEQKEAYITMDSLKDANAELANELEEVKKALVQARSSQAAAIAAASSTTESATASPDRERRKQEKLRYMMASFENGSHGKLEGLLQQVGTFPGLTEDQRVALRTQVETLRETVDAAELGLAERNETVDALTRRKEDVESRLRQMQQDYQALLDKTLRSGGTLSEEDIRALQQSIEAQNQATATAADTRQLELDAERAAEELRHLRATVKALQRGAAAAGSNGEAGGLSAAQAAEFDVMKRSLMRDLQSRCERVVELEIALDETREQYASVLRAANSRQQHKKMAFLERNLEQLTSVQRQLVDQNASLKKEVAIAERKLIARNDRITSLEHLLHDAQDKLMNQNARFEQQLSTVRERLEAARIKSSNSTVGTPTQSSSSVGSAFGGFFSNAGGKIAKPLRGGGSDNANGMAGGAAPVTPVSALKLQEQSATKRNSWFGRG
ncbi:hypothetical protein PYCC9005_002182 [Savitreella phatthalungensis]